MDMKVNIAGVEWKNPVTVASGTFGSGEEFSEFVDLNRLGAVTTKGVANVPWPGNPTPRVAEVYGGMMNAIGLQNPGIDLFCKRDIPFLKKYDTKIIVNVCGLSLIHICSITATGDAKKKIEADCGVGEINLKIKGKQKDYNYDLDCGIGEIRCGDDSFSGFGREKSIDNGADKKMDIDCGIGSINVAFMEQLSLIHISVSLSSS